MVGPQRIDRDQNDTIDDVRGTRPACSAAKHTDSQQEDERHAGGPRTSGRPESHRLWLSLLCLNQPFAVP
jgi:hypothetical protein